MRSGMAVIGSRCWRVYKHRVLRNPSFLQTLWLRYHEQVWQWWWRDRLPLSAAHLLHPSHFQQVVDRDKSSVCHRVWPWHSHSFMGVAWMKGGLVGGRCLHAIACCCMWVVRQLLAGWVVQGYIFSEVVASYFLAGCLLEEIIGSIFFLCALPFSDQLLSVFSVTQSLLRDVWMDLDSSYDKAVANLIFCLFLLIFAFTPGIFHIIFYCTFSF